METTSKQPGNNKRLYLIIGIIAAVLIAISVLFYIQNREMNTIVENLNVEKTILTEEYQKLAFNYDSLHSDNDTLNLMLEMERERIAQLVEELKTLKATNTARIREFQKELTTLRDVLRTYIVQIDSLNQRNQVLTQENLEQDRKSTRLNSSHVRISYAVFCLKKKVTIASRLDVTNLMAEGLNPSGRRSEEHTSELQS